MANAYVYYYPAATGGIEKLDLGQGLQTLRREPVTEGRIGRAVGGEVYPSALGQYERVRASLEGITDEDIVARLRSFETHQKRGRQWALSADHAKTWAGYLPRGARRGWTTLRTGGNAYSAFNSGGALASGDYVVIESGYPEHGFEVAKVSSVSGGTITLSAGLKYNYRVGPVLVRYYRFWPRLHTDDGAAIVSDIVPGFVWRADLAGMVGAAATPTAAERAPLLETSDGPTKGGGKVTTIAGGQSDPVRAGDLGLPGRR